MIKTSLISVFDKNGIVKFSKSLSDLGIKILSTGGTAKILHDSGIDVRDVSEYIGYPEMLDGRVKTLHPKIYGGILALRNNKQHMKQAEENGIEMIDMVVVNLYPFEQTIREKKSFEQTIEMIDIGGPSMVRSAAKNFEYVVVITDPNDYDEVISELKKNGDISLEKRKRLASKAFGRTSAYDARIREYLSDNSEIFPKMFAFPFTKKQDLRYGENPYQDAAFYVSENICEPSIANAEQLHGKELSYNNIIDGDSAIEIVKEFREPCAAVIKHTNPSGVAVGNSMKDALEKAYNADQLSAFGCVISLNRICNKACAEFLRDRFIEVIIAPDYEKEAFKILTEKKDRRILKLPSISDIYSEKTGHELLTLKKVVGGLLVQTRNFPELWYDSVNIINNENPSKEDIAKLTNEAKQGTLKELICVTKKKPTKKQIMDMIFAIKVCKHVKSNSVLYAKDLVTVGIGAGQMSRVDAAIIATRKSAGKAQQAIMCSDAFFPFRDGIDEAAKAGISAVIQPGGSIRDREVIDAANEHGISMVFSGTRLFLH